MRSRRKPPSQAPVRSIVQRWRPSRSDGSIMRRASLTLPPDEAAEGYKAMDERRAIKVLLTV
jgi:threonine dehydrogenase-like Zn-dependent dehydrogenase